MGRVIAIDYGIKRIGVAVSDEMKLIASGLCTVDTKNIFSFLTGYLKKEDVEIILVGKPTQMNNQPSESEKYIIPFLKKLKTTFPKISVIRIDERFTSKIAFQTMIDSGLKKKQRQNKELIDEISATIILQSYLYNK